MDCAAEAPVAVHLTADEELNAMLTTLQEHIGMELCNGVREWAQRALVATRTDLIEMLRDARVRPPRSARRRGHIATSTLRELLLHDLISFEMARVQCS